VAYDRKQEGHHVAQANRPDYRLEVGRAEVAVGVARDFEVLDAGRAEILRAWVATLIPAAGRRPDAAEVGAAEYVDATVLLVPALRPSLLQAVDAIERLAQTKAGRAFAACAAPERERLLREFEAEDRTDAFNMVRDFTYEAYYGHPRAIAALEAETGWRGAAPTTGSAMTPFDESHLKRVRSLPAHWRQVADEKASRA
jgi:hypothetical protein